MKTRNGFVSNSSSSSFVFLGFPKTEIQDNNIDYKSEVLKKVTKREMNNYAFDNIRRDDEYDDYSNGGGTELFWKKAWKHFIEDADDDDIDPVDKGEYTCRNINDEKWMGIDIVYVGDGGNSKQFNVNEIERSKQKIQHDYPNVTPKLILGTTEEG